MQARKHLPATILAAAWLLSAGAGALCAAEPSGPVRITDDGLFKQRPAWSPDGKRLCFSRHEGNAIRLYVMGANGADQKRLTDRLDPEYDAVWSPDGLRLAAALVKVSGTQGDVDVYSLDGEGKNAQLVAGNVGKLSHEESPAWSPDGKRVCFSSTRDGNQELYIADSDGSAVQRLTSDAALDAHPVWSPDGKRLAFATDRWGDLELATIEADGSNLARLTASPGLDDYPAWSPDGARLAYTSNRDANYEIYVCDASGQNVVNLTQNEGLDHFAAWSPDGKRLAFVSDRDGGFELYLADVSAKE